MTPNRSGQHFTSTQRKANFDHERLYGTTPLALAPRPRGSPEEGARRQGSRSGSYPTESRPGPGADLGPSLSR